MGRQRGISAPSVHMHDPIGVHMHGQVAMWTFCICSPYAVTMVSREKDTHTTNRVFRVSDEDWEAFGRIAGERNRAQVLRDFIAWYVRRPKAHRPTRPDDAAASA